MDDVLAAKSVMQQSLFDDVATRPPDPVIVALAAAEARWRSLAIAGLALGGTALVLALIALLL